MFKQKGDFKVALKVYLSLRDVGRPKNWIFSDWNNTYVEKDWDSFQKEWKSTKSLGLFEEGFNDGYSRAEKWINSGVREKDIIYSFQNSFSELDFSTNIMVIVYDVVQRRSLKQVSLITSSKFSAIPYAWGHYLGVYSAAVRYALPKLSYNWRCSSMDRDYVVIEKIFGNFAKMLKYCGFDTELLGRMLGAFVKKSTNQHHRDFLLKLASYF